VNIIDGQYVFAPLLAEIGFRAFSQTKHSYDFALRYIPRNDVSLMSGIGHLTSKTSIVLLANNSGKLLGLLCQQSSK
jgi:hypothetical protein